MEMSDNNSTLDMTSEIVGIPNIKKRKNQKQQQQQQKRHRPEICKNGLLLLLFLYFHLVNTHC